MQHTWKINERRTRATLRNERGLYVVTVDDQLGREDVDVKLYRSGERGYEELETAEFLGGSMLQVGMAAAEAHAEGADDDR